MTLQLDNLTQAVRFSSCAKLLAAQPSVTVLHNFCLQGSPAFPGSARAAAKPPLASGTPRGVLLKAHSHGPKASSAGRSPGGKPRSDNAGAQATPIQAKVTTKMCWIQQLGAAVHVNDPCITIAQPHAAASLITYVNSASPYSGGCGLHELCCTV